MAAQPAEVTIFRGNTSSHEWLHVYLHAPHASARSGDGAGSRTVQPNFKSFERRPIALNVDDFRAEKCVLRASRLVRINL